MIRVRINDRLEYFRSERKAIGKKRYGVVVRGLCEICGYDLTTDIHHHGNMRYELCPNHHALITRKIRTMEELLSEKLIPLSAE
jgi:hypothetical protein